MNKSLITFVVCFLLSVISCVSQIMETEKLIEKALLFYCGNNKNCTEEMQTDNKIGFLRGEIIPFQFVDTIYLIKVFEVNKSHPNINIIPISVTGNIIEQIELKEFNKLSFDDSLSIIDKSILYLLMNGSTICDFFSWEVNNKNDNESSRIIKTIKDIKFSKHAYVIPNHESHYAENFQIKTKESRQGAICVIYLNGDSKSKVLRKKLIFKNGYLIKVKSKSY